MSGGEDGKRRATSTKRCKHEDRISQLPDDILIPIISHLNLQEAAATSILTPRWRYLYTYTTHLHFSRFIPRYGTGQDVKGSFPGYINAINRALDSHKGIRIKEFRVHTYCLKQGATIDKWFEFALDKDVEILHIHLLIIGYYAYYPLRENLKLTGETLICLKELSLLGIDVNDEDIQLLLRKFLLLESLSIKGSSSLRHVAIVGHSSSKLKHLEISRGVRNSRSIEIEIDNFANLISLWCLELAFSLKIKNVPKLIEFSMFENYNGSCTCARILSEMPSSIHHQLQTLKIFTSPIRRKEYEQLMSLQLKDVKV